MNDKRLAVKVEDHPIEYGDFEGIIPQGNYGAGGVIVWDRGAWVPLEDWRTGLEKGKLLFELRGYKLHGKWTLVKIKKTENEWLLIKERDAWVAQPGDQFNETSVLSGLTVEEVKAGKSPGARLRETLEKTEAARQRVDAASIEVMLATPSEEAFTRDGWLFELKLDGYRLLASKSHGEALLLTRNGNDYTDVFPEIALAVQRLPIDDFIIDGEVVVLDGSGTPRFSQLQKRGRLTSSLDVRRAAVDLPATFFAFDFLAFDDFDLRPLPLTERKRLLTETIPKLGPVRVLDHIDREGAAFLKQVALVGLEGIIAKKANAPYRGGRSKHWLKIKAERTGDFVVVGFTAPKGGRAHIGALQLADMVGGTLVYAGRVGTGFNDAMLGELKAMADKIIRRDPPCAGPVTAPGTEPLASEDIPETKTTTWIDPVLVCEAKYREFTPDGVLRHAVFLRFRNDKAPHECERQHWAMPPGDDISEAAVAEGDEGPHSRADAEPPPPPPKAPVQKTIAFSNPKKIYWPAERYTKGDMIEYYRAVSPWILPYLRNRPAVLTRFPDGIDGKSFYQKDAPDFVPEWIRTVPIWSEETQRDISYFVCDDEESILYVANMGSIPLHIWASRVGSLELPDWCVMDLDPKEAPFSDVVRTAQVVHRLCEAAGLPNYVKTTGKTGLHILLPLGRQFTYAQSRTLGELLARLALRELGDIATITRHVTKRGDKVYLDYLQNRHGQTIVAPFSVRPLPGATVSMPLIWDEVNESLDPKAFTIRTAIERIERLGTDPVAPVLEEKLDLVRVLDKLAQIMASG
jgi:bifunctional non-homologous end joining protein LigD